MNEYNKDSQGGGRMQKAVDSWEKSAAGDVKSEDAEKSTYSDYETRQDISRKIKEIARQKSGAAAEELTKTRVMPANHDYKHEYTDGNPESHSESETGTREFAPHLRPDSPREPQSPQGRNTAQHEQPQFQTIKKQRVSPPNASRDYSEDLSLISKSVLGLEVRFFLSALFTFISLMLMLSPVLHFPMPPFVSKSNFAFVAAQAILLLIVGVLNPQTAFFSIKCIFKRIPSYDSLNSLAFYGAMLGCAYFLVNSSANGHVGVTVYAPVASVCVSLSLLSRIFDCKVREKNLESLKPGKYYELRKVSGKTASHISKISEDEMPCVLYPTAIGDAGSALLEVPRFETSVDMTAKILGIAIMAVAAVSALCLLIFRRDITGAVSVASAVCCIAPFGIKPVLSVAIYKSCKRLAGEDAFICGGKAMVHSSDADVLVVDDHMFFPGTARVYGIKTFGGQSLENAVVYASSIANAVSGTLARSFLKLISSENSGRDLESILKTPYKLSYENETGISAVIDGKQILFGSRSLLRKSMIEPPSREYESRHMIKGRDVIYLAVSGQLWAMFIVCYNPQEGFSDSLKRLQRMELSLLIETTDPNITPQLVEDKYDLGTGFVRTLGSREMSLLHDESHGERRKTGIIFKNLRGYADAVTACIRLSGTMAGCAMMLMVSSLLGLIVVVVASMLGAGAGNIWPIFLTIYQAVCLLPIMLVCFFRRH